MVLTGHIKNVHITKDLYFYFGGKKPWDNQEKEGRGGEEKGRKMNREGITPYLQGRIKGNPKMTENR